MDISSTHEPLVLILELSAEGSQFSSIQRPFALSIVLDSNLAPKMPPRPYFLQQGQAYPDSVGRFGEEAKGADAWAESASLRVQAAIASRMGEFELSEPPQTDASVRLLSNQAMALVRFMSATVAKGPNGEVASSAVVKAVLDQIAPVWVSAWAQELGFEPHVLGLPGESGFPDIEEMLMGLELKAGAPLRLEAVLWNAFERGQAQQQALALQQETAATRANFRKKPMDGEQSSAEAGISRSAPRI